MLLIYQIKVGLCLIAFYLLWKLLLSRETFHRFNRVALLTVMALAMVLPWMRLSLDVAAPVAKQMVVLEDLIVTPNTPQVAAQQSSWSVMGIATVLYFIGMALVAASPNNEDIQLMTLMNADNSWSYYDEATDLWPQNGKTEFTDTSTPAAKLNMNSRGAITGRAGYLGKPVTDMVINQDGTASFWYMKGSVTTPTITVTADAI